MNIVVNNAQLMDLTVVIPARNAEQLLPACMESAVRERPCAVIVVDGESTDRTADIAREYGAMVVSDQGQGLPVARELGTELAETPYVALVDADVVLPEGALHSLREELVEKGYTGLQAGLRSIGGPRYWGRALAQHHRWGRSKNWFGLVATIFERDTLLRIGFDHKFVSGEDIELRWRLQREGACVGVSERTMVTHRFGDDSFSFARMQFHMDGRGLGKMIRKHGWRGVPLLALPAAAAVRGICLSLAKLRPQWIPYYVCFALFNYLAMAGELAQAVSGATGRHQRPVAGNPMTGGVAGKAMTGSAIGLVIGRGAALGLGFLFWLVAARVAAPATVGLTAGVVSAMMLCTQFGQLGAGQAFIALYPRHLKEPAPLLNTVLSMCAIGAIAVGLAFLLLAGAVFTQLGQVAHHPVWVVAFLVLSVSGTAQIAFDQISMGLERGGQAVTRNVACGLLALVPLAVLPALGGGVSSLGLFLAWVLGGVGTVTVGLWQLWRTCGGYVYRPRLVPSLVPATVTTGLANHVLTLAERVPGLILPIVVTELLSPRENAYWYIIWMSALVVYITPQSVGIALFAEGSHRPGAMSAATTRALRLSLIFGGGCAVVLGLIANPMLSLLGDGYEQAGAGPLRILLLGVIPMSLISAYYARCRAMRRLPEAIATGILGGLIAVFVTALAGVHFGLPGMAIGWVVVQTVVAVWAGLRLWLARW
jgi:O-antigen/teichoic acid export membrane protein/glycosyltransferase involved in cell wall biosynthesis